MSECAACPQHLLTIDVLEQTRREGSVQSVRLDVALALLRRLRGWTPDEDPHAKDLLADVSTFLALPGCSQSDAGVDHG
jgi:hypothetical protein